MKYVPWDVKFQVWAEVLSFGCADTDQIIKALGQQSSFSLDSCGSIFATLDLVHLTVDLNAEKVETFVQGKELQGNYLLRPI